MGNNGRNMRAAVRVAAVWAAAGASAACGGAFADVFAAGRPTIERTDTAVISPDFTRRGALDAALFVTVPGAADRAVFFEPPAYIAELDFGPTIRIKITSLDYDNDRIATRIDVPAETAEGERAVTVTLVAGSRRLTARGRFFVLPPLPAGNASARGR